ncbi:hypothetical protein GCM10023238_32190 [Streptomyces heliomycini]
MYAAVDEVLDLPAGTTRKSLAKADLKLPDEAGQPGGLPLPATYPLKERRPRKKLLSRMVDTATRSSTEYRSPPARSATR